MSNGASHKMYDYEVAPPPGVWEKIESALEEAELSQKFPPALYNFQVNPPAPTWQKIANALDEPIFVSDYAAKLGSIAIAPPAAAWEKIKTALEPAPLRRISTPWIKYAAAAAILAFLAWGGMQLFNKNNNKETVAGTKNNNPTGEPVSSPVKEAIAMADGNLAVADMNAALEEARNDAALEASKKTYAKLDVGAKRSKIKNVTDFAFRSSNDEYNSPTPGTSRGLDDIDLSVETPPVDIANRYFVLMTPEGNIFRMSKKLGNLVCCVSGEEMDKDCADQMKKWREKIASPSATHTPGNFLDLLHMLNSMQDN